MGLSLLILAVKAGQNNLFGEMAKVMGSGGIPIPARTVKGEGAVGMDGQVHPTLIRSTLRRRHPIEKHVRDREYVAPCM